MDSGIDMVAWGVDDGISRERCEDIRLQSWVGSYKLLRHYANYGEGNVGDDEFASDYIGSAVKPALSEALTDNDGETIGVAAGLVVGWRKIAAHPWSGLKRGEELTAYEHSVDVFVAGVALNLHDVRVVGEDVREDIAPLLKAAEEGCAQAVVGLRAAIFDAQYGELFGVRHGERAQE
jgi:hypothetical protein